MVEISSLLSSKSRRRSSAANSSIVMKSYKQIKRIAFEIATTAGSSATIHHMPRFVTRDEDSKSSGNITSIRSSLATNSTNDRSSITILDTQSPQPKKPSFNQTYKILPGIKGNGIAGEVRSSIHRTSSQLCAVKTMSKSRIQRKDLVKREICFLKEVQHPNIIQLYDVYEDQNEVNIVMELCHGGELFDKIVEKATLSKNHRSKNIDGNNHHQVPALACFHEKDAAHIIHSLLSAVSYLHSKDIVHRDIKPENILFAEKDNDKSPIKLIDFGLSIRHTQNCKPLSNSVGTAYYMSAEVLNGSYDRSCDLWSIGVITYVMLSGHPPFNGSTDKDIFKTIRKGRYNMENSAFGDSGVVSDLAKDFIRCLLDDDPRRRWNADMALNHAWFQEVCSGLNAKKATLLDDV